MNNMKIDKKKKLTELFLRLDSTFPVPVRNATKINCKVQDSGKHYIKKHISVLKY